MANICKLCAHPDQEMVRAAFAAGGSDRELARQLGVSHMAIGRHRRAHIVGLYAPCQSGEARIA
jgi:hypothetical protein